MNVYESKFFLPERETLDKHFDGFHFSHEFENNQEYFIARMDDFIFCSASFDGLVDRLYGFDLDRIQRNRTKKLNEQRSEEIINMIRKEKEDG